jgi:hypothetical protein
VIITLSAAVMPFRRDVDIGHEPGLSVVPQTIQLLLVSSTILLRCSGHDIVFIFSR